MKTNAPSLCLIFLAVVCHAQSHLSQQERMKILSEHLPQSTNSVSLTTNMVFFLSSEKHGLFPENNFQSDEVIYYGLLGTSTNHVWYRHFPSGEFDFHLFDKSGNEVSKRKAGSALTVTPAKASKHDLMFWRTSHLNPYNVDNHGGEYHSLFRPDDIFIITNSGTYALVIQMRLCLIMTNGLPDLSAMVDARTVTEHNPDKFGVFTSPQLRVKVVKGDFPKPD